MENRTVTYRSDVTGEIVTAQLVPIGLFPWSDDYSWSRMLTCLNHSTARYYTKNPFWRNLHLVKLPQDANIPRSGTGECTCPMEYLAVIVAPGSNEEIDYLAGNIKCT